MISLSKEWALLSRSMYGEEYIEELSQLFRVHNVQNIIECGCGDGNILYGLAKNGFVCTGVDLDKEMIQLARNNSSQSNITFLCQDWLTLKGANKKYDALLCRGNSLPYVISWDNSTFNPEIARQKIEESISLFFGLVKKEGLVYIDTVPHAQLNQKLENISLNYENVRLEGMIEHNLTERTRKTHGQGVLSGEHFQGGTVGYLIFPEELQEIMEKYASNVWRPKFRYEKNYEIICAIK